MNLVSRVSFVACFKSEGWFTSEFDLWKFRKSKLLEIWTNNEKFSLVSVKNFKNFASKL